MTSHRRKTIFTAFAVSALICALICTLFVCTSCSEKVGVKTADGKLTVSVSPNADVTVADGSAKKPFATIESARDAVRSVDKTKYTGIDIVIAPGVYCVSEAIQLTEEDCGSGDCPVRYIGGDGVIITGGISLRAENFSPVGEDFAAYLKDGAREHIVQIDLTQYGIDYKKDVYSEYNLNSSCPALCVNGDVETIARYPNEGWAKIASGHVESDMDPAAITDNTGVITTILYGEEHDATLRSWHSTENVYVCGKFTYLWCSDNTRMLSLDGSSPVMTVAFRGGYEPRANMPFYWYNIPEELDMPGEYYIDENAVLYYYPRDGFETAVITLPHSHGIFRINGADHVTLEKLDITSCLGNAVEIAADYVTVDSCTVSGIMGSAIIVDGDGNTVSSCTVHDIGAAGIKMSGGDLETLTPSGSVCCDNTVYNWAMTETVYNPAFGADGVGITVSHNEMYNSPHLAIIYGGNDHVFEYNNIHDVCLEADDSSAVYAGGFGGCWNNVLRYNYIHDVGPNADSYSANIDGYPYYGAHGIYWDNGGSGQSAYCNLFFNIAGNGVFINGGRNCDVHDNIFVACNNYAVFYPAWAYNRLFKEFITEYEHTAPPFADTEVWRAAYPELCRLVYGMENANPFNPLLSVIPADSVVENNFVLFDRATSFNASRGKFEAFSTEYPVEEFSNIENPDVEYYSSKRSGNPTMEEAIEKASDTTSLTPVDFAEIGPRTDK